MERRPHPPGGSGAAATDGATVASTTMAVAMTIIVIILAAIAVTARVLQQQKADRTAYRAPSEVAGIPFQTFIRHTHTDGLNTTSALTEDERDSVKTTGSWDGSGSAVTRVPRVQGLRDQTVPLIMWRTSPYKWGEVPRNLAAAMNETARMSPAFTQVYCDNSACISLVSRFMPEAVAAFRSLVHWTMRAHVWRLVALWVFGGVHMSAGVALHTPLQAVVAPSGLTLLEGAGTAICAAPARHPAIYAMLAALLSNVLAQKPGPSVDAITGPVAVASAVRAACGSGATLTPGWHTWQLGSHVFPVSVLSVEGNDVMGPGPMSTGNTGVSEGGSHSHGPTPRASLGVLRCPMYFALLYADKSRPTAEALRRVSRGSGLYKAVPQFLTYASFKSWLAQNTGTVYAQPTAMPRILWRTASFPAEELPDEVADAMATFTVLAPEWTQVYMSDADVEAHLLELHAPHLVTAYRSLIPGAFRADLWRLVVLLQYGGLYSDIGHLLLRPLEPAISVDADALLLVPDRVTYANGYAARIYNALMGAPPGSPLLQAMLDAVVDNVLSRRYGSEDLDITGPTTLGRAFTSFFHLPRTERLQQGRYAYHHRAASTAEPEAVNVSFLYNDDCTRLGTAQAFDLEPLLRTKFPRYMEVMYPPTRPAHYGVLWKLRQVFAENA